MISKGVGSVEQYEYFGKMGLVMRKYLIPLVFWLLIGCFGLIVATALSPVVRGLIHGVPFLTILSSIFLLGGALVFLVLRQRVGESLRKFLLLTGGSAVGFFVFSVLHNLIYGVLAYFLGADFWDNVGLGDEPFFFFIAILICPIGFLVGVAGSVVLFIRRR